MGCEELRNPCIFLSRTLEVLAEDWQAPGGCGSKWHILMCMVMCTVTGGTSRERETGGGGVMKGNTWRSPAQVGED